MTVRGAVCVLSALAPQVVQDDHGFLPDLERAGREGIGLEVFELLIEGGDEWLATARRLA